MNTQEENKNIQSEKIDEVEKNEDINVVLKDNQITVDAQSENIDELNQSGNMIVCAHCGQQIEKNHSFCPSCGKKVGTKKIDGLKSNKKMMFGLGIAALVVLVFIFSKSGGPQSIELEYDNATIEQGKVGFLDYTIYPEDINVEDIHLTWTSSNPSVITVSETGTIVACSTGTSTITVRTDNGKKDECVITVTQAKTNLKSVFDLYCDDQWATVASDGSYLSIDTNPQDSAYNYHEEEAIKGIYLVHSALDIPDSVIEKMSRTNALSGIQSTTHGDIEISWSYHPDNGLEIIYEVAD